MNDTIKVYKGFNADWTCRDFQFKLGETYTLPEAARTCEYGFHACEYPLDIFNYYAPTGQFAECELSGLAPKKEDGDTKRAGNKITVKASLTISMLVAASIEYTTTRCEPANAKHSEGHQSASSATGGSIRLERHGVSIRLERHGGSIRLERHGGSIRLERHGGSSCCRGVWPGVKSQSRCNRYHPGRMVGRASTAQARRYWICWRARHRARCVVQGR